MDLNTYESIALARLREAGCNNNVVVADARMLAQAMGDAFRRPKFAGRRYSLIGAESLGVFHPKLILQLGTKSGRLLVASANMTAAGLAGNLEVVGEVSADQQNQTATPIIRAALEYLVPILGSMPVPRRQIDWAMNKASWLYDAPPGPPIVDLGAGRRVGFLARDGLRSISDRFVELVGSRQVTRLIVVSPYWDENLSALRELARRLEPQITAVVVQPQSALFPAHVWQESRGWKLFDTASILGTVASRFVHAKLIVAETPAGDCVLFGSANCTTAALGAGDFPGANDEACLYRELPKGEAVRVLGLEAAVAEAHELSSNDLPPYKPAPAIPLTELSASLPGRFELSGATLSWWPPKALDVNAARIELSDHAGNTIDTLRLTPVSLNVFPLTFAIAGQGQPLFARVLAPDFASSLAVITIEQAIQEAQRRVKSKAEAAALDFLDDQEAFEGLWILELVQKLEAANRDRRRSAGEDEVPTANHKIDDRPAQRLTYEQFIAGRRDSDTQDFLPVSSHLASGHHESVRAFLNALVGNGMRESSDSEGAWLNSAPLFPLGDETQDGSRALDLEDRFASHSQLAGLSEDAARKRLRRQQEFVKDTQNSIAKAADQFVELLREEVKTRPLSIVDVLRLRVMLMVVLGSGSKYADLLPKELGASISRRQTLPSRGEASWRRLSGKLLFAFFRQHGGSQGALINKLEMRGEAGIGLPADVLECWATCYWTLCASRVAVDEAERRFEILPAEQRIAADLYKCTALSFAELTGERLTAVFEGMGRRYADRLGVSIASLWREHQTLVSTSRGEIVPESLAPPRALRGSAPWRSPAERRA